LKNIRDTKPKDERLDFLDIKSALINHELRGIPNADLTERFCIENGGIKNEILYLGFRIKSTTPFPAIQKRVIPLFRPSRIYMKLHCGGFKHGVNWTNLGFFLKQHPKFTDFSSLKHEVSKMIVHGWDHDHNIFDDEKKKDIQKIIDPTRAPQEFRDFSPRNIPIEIIPGVITAINTQDEKMNANVVIASIPYKFQRLGIAIMDYLAVEAKTLDNYIPMGMRRTEPEGFYDILESYNTWKFQHRTIVITNVATRRQYDTEKNQSGNTLTFVLNNIPHVDNVFFEPSNGKVLLSASVNTYEQVFKDTITAMKQSKFESFEPNVKKPFLSSGTGSVASKYSDILNRHRPNNRSPTASIATSTGDNNTRAPSIRSTNGRKIPRAIDLTGAAQFPDLPRVTTNIPTPVNVTMTPPNKTHIQALQGTYEPTPTTNSDLESSIQSAITKALQQQELRHNQEMQSALERCNKLQTRLEQQQNEFLKQRENDNEQRREEARARRDEQDQQQRFQQQLQEDARYQRDDMRRQQKEAQAQFDRLFTMLMTTQTLTSHEASPMKQSPHRKKSRPSNRSPMKPQYLDDAMTKVIDTTQKTTTNTDHQPRTARNATPYHNTHMDTDTDESFHKTNNDDQLSDQEFENKNNNPTQHPVQDQTLPHHNHKTTGDDTNDDDDPENKSQANTHYSDRSVTTIEEGDEQEVSTLQVSPEQQYDDQGDELSQSHHYDHNADSFTLRKSSTYSVPPYNPAPKVTHRQGRGGYGQPQRQDRSPDGPLLTVLPSSRRSTTLRERED